MKICPNCKSEMGADVNFCTNCGTNIQDVPVTNKEEEVKPVAEEQLEAKAEAKQESEKIVTRAEYQQQDDSATEEANFFKEKGSLDEEGIYHPANIWDWLTYSWKHPMKEQMAESWFGWVTFLVEDILLIIGLASASARVGNMMSPGMGSQVFALQLPFFAIFLYLVLIQVVCLGVYYLGYRFIYGSNRSFNNFVNHVVQVGNINAILVAVAFLFMLILNPVLVAIALTLFLTVWTASFQVILLGDPDPVHDKFYSYLVLQVFFAIVFMIIFAIIGLGIAGGALGLFSNLI